MIKRLLFVLGVFVFAVVYTFLSALIALSLPVYLIGCVLFAVVAVYVSEVLDVG